MSDPLLYARSFADVYDQWYTTLDDPAELVTAAVGHCLHGGTIVELGSGTGRLAKPLHDAGFNVIALDIATSMLTAAAPGPAPVAADATHIPLQNNSADLVIVAYNTLFNMASRAAQQRCFAEAARILRPHAMFAVEAFVAPDVHRNFGITVRDHPSDPDRKLAILTGPSPDHPEIVDGSHVELGATTTCRPWQLVYQSPAELDVAATRSGLQLTRRVADWAGNTFDENQQRHVSWYKRI